MPRDELRQPLRKRSLKERLWARRPGGFTLAAVSIAALFLGGGIWLVRQPHPFAGEPVVTAMIPPVEELHTATAEPARDAETSAPAGTEDVIDENAGIAEANAGVQEELPSSEPPAYQNEASIIIARTRPLKKAPVAAVTEDSPQGPLPKVSSAGKKPFDVYSQVTPLQVVTSIRPKITILLGGMGLNKRLTEKAIKELPGDISLGFAPYGEDLQEQVNRARANGHEVMLQMPMEPVGYPGNNPGPKTLLAEGGEKENIDSLQWLMSRFSGYSGVTNYMGARFLVTESSLSPVMKELKKRGLVYLEDATVNLTLSPKVAQNVRLPLQRASMVIDSEPTAPAIADMLQKLEAEAIANGSAIATGSGLEVTIDTVAEWAKSLQEKGILLVPVSAAYKGRAT
jgi:polysaccharide deacetylase 2 family uncharacterized protein YibQ